jgi:hypothetical protein
VRSLGIILLLAGAIGSCAAQWKDGGRHSGKNSAEDELPNPVEILLKAERVDDSAVGYAGLRTPAYRAFSQMYRAGKNYSGQAKHLVEAGSAAGKIYGYLLLRHISPSDAESAAKSLERNTAQVQVMNGCLLSHSTVSGMIARIQKGDTVILLPQ